jgi:hypothetical protein
LEKNSGVAFRIICGLSEKGGCEEFGSRETPASFSGMRWFRMDSAAKAMPLLIGGTPGN